MVTFQIIGKSVNDRLVGMSNVTFVTLADISNSFFQCFSILTGVVLETNVKIFSIIQEIFFTCS